MRRVLVTGGSGFVGRAALGPLAARGYEVHVADVRPPPLRDGVVFHRVDLLDRAATSSLLDIIRPSHLLHLAWFATHRLFWSAPENLGWVAASLELVRAFRDRGGERAVFAGSCAEYDPAAGWCSERSSALAPDTLYGSAKDALRRTIAAWAPAAGLSWAWGRVFFLHGPGEHPDRLVPAVARAVLSGQATRTTHGLQVRDFLHVEDVAGAFAALVDTSVEGPVNIASGEPRRLRDVVHAVTTAAGASQLARFGDLEPSPREPPFLVADVRRLRDEVGFVPRWSFEDGIADSVRHWRSEAS